MGTNASLSQSKSSDLEGKMEENLLDRRNLDPDTRIIGSEGRNWGVYVY